MYTKHAEIKSTDALKLRPASKFVETAKKYQSEIYIINDNEQINAKSFRGLCASEIRRGCKIALRAEGPDEQEAVDALYHMMEEGNLV